MRFMDYLFISVSIWIIVTFEGRTDGSSLFQSEDESVYKEVLSGIPGSWYEIVNPTQVRNGEILSNIDTRDLKSKQKHHFHSTNFEMNLLGKKLKIKLDLNRELLSNGFKLKYNQNTKVQVVEEMSVENCFYQGQVRRVPDSIVVLSTCNGLRGVIVLAHQVYVIHPLPQAVNSTEAARFPHVVYRSVPDTKTTCANDRGMWVSYKDLHHGDFLRNLKIMKLDGDSVLTETKYMRTALVVDNTFYSRLNRSLTDTLQHVGLVANIADALLNDDNVKIKLRLVYVELWNQHDLFDVSSNARQALTGFLRYRKDTLTHVRFNYAHFISGRHFDSNELGMAIADSVCSDNAVAVSKSESVHDIWQSAFGVVHMLAHILGVNHDATEHCMCNDLTGCIMSRLSSNILSPLARSWSTCSIKDIHTSIRSRLSGCLSTANSTSGATIDQQEMMYRQTCGNGIMERGEECDCQNTEECELLDPCCDAKTCLLKPWATCRHGNCCHNCTVRPSNQMCRSAVGECDVPEFCDGLSGHCPGNTLTQDGQVCGNEHGYCYQGVCRTYSNQCQSLWGATAVAADNKCYDTFNTAGRFNGHCGHNGTSTDYMKCSIENTKCGLLHCSGGSEKPLLGQNQTFSKTVVYSDGKEYECKIVNGALDSDPRSVKARVGMVQDGSRCGHGAVCIGTECVALSHVMPVTCVVGSNGAVCSGHGVCTTDLRCFCSDGWAGIDCSERSNMTIIPLPTSTTEVSLTTLFREDESLNNVTDNVTTTSSSTLQAKVTPKGSKADTASTLWLLIVLVVVVGVAVMLLAFCLLCYRRRSPLSQKKKKTAKGSKHGTFGNLSSFGSSSYNKQQEILRSSPVNSVVKFGKTPSWKAEKMKRAMKQQRESGASETGSADRDSTEFKQVPSLPPADPPERGILKKCSSRSSVDGVRRTRTTSQCSLASHATSTKASTVELVAPLTVLCDDSGKGVADEQLEFIDGEDEDQCSYCDCSVEEDGESVKEEGDDDGADGSNKSGCNQETQTDLDSPSSSMSRTSVYGESGNKLARLSNINELLRQIDEQFNSVLRATTATADLSPTTSEDFRGSETEADRACGGFYRQLDADGACPATGTKLLPASQRRDGLVLHHSPQSSFSVVSNAGQSVPVSDTEMSSRSSFKPLALPLIPKLLEFGCSPEGDTDVRWRPQAFVPYRGLLTTSEVTADPLRWNSPASSTTLPLCTVASSSPATVPSEGYHSDRGGTGSEIDAPIILREIPRQSKNALRLTSASAACDSTTLSCELLHSPEDVDV